MWLISWAIFVGASLGGVAFLEIVRIVFTAKDELAIAA
jgi:hypothetical protein